MGKEDNKLRALIFIEQYMSMHRYSLVFETMVSVDKSICLLYIKAYWSEKHLLYRQWYTAGGRYKNYIYKFKKAHEALGWLLNEFGVLWQWL